MTCDGRVARSSPQASISCLPRRSLYSRELVEMYCGVKPVTSPPWLKPRSTRYMMMNTGICNSKGKHEAIGLTLCCWYSFIISSLSF